MNMIVRTAYAFRNALSGTYRSAEVRVQAFSPFVGDERKSVFGAEHNMHVQA